MDQAIEIRDVTAADLDALVALNAEVQDLHAASMPWQFKPSGANQDAVKAQFDTWLLEENLRIVLALFDGHPVGYMILRIRETPDHAFCYARRLLYVDHISVASAHRGKGVGRRLIEEAKAMAETRGIARIELDYWHFNDAAGAFFSAQGFQPARHIVAMTV